MKNKPEKNLPLTFLNEQASLKIKETLTAVTAKIEKVLFNNNDQMQLDDSLGDKQGQEHD